MKKIRSQPLKTLLTIVTGFIILSLFKHTHWLIYPALCIGLAGLISERLCLLIESAWMKLAHVLSFIVPTILLTGIFFLLLFPLSLLSKVFKKSDPLKLSHATGSTFVSSEKKFDRASFEKPW